MKNSEKTYLERIAEALEKEAGITHVDAGYLDEKTYLERIADAIEALYPVNDNSDVIDDNPDVIDS